MLLPMESFGRLMLMSRYEKFPRSYADAAAILGDEAEVTISPGQACYGVGGSWLRKTQDGISTCNRYGAIVTFHPDNRIKIITQGRNDSWHVEHINSCLPKRY